MYGVLVKGRDYGMNSLKSKSSIVLHRTRLKIVYYALCPDGVIRKGQEPIVHTIDSNVQSYDSKQWEK